jgi:hypothetical protein
VRKRLVIGGLLAAVALSMVVGIVSARGGSASAPRLSAWGFGAGTASPVPHITQDRRLAFRATNFVATSIDNDPAGTSQGDALAVEGTLSTRRADSAGRLEVTEVFTGLAAGGGARLLVTVTATLNAGQITAIGVGRVSQSGQITIKLPVAGGTGKYRNVRGVLIAEPAGNTTRLTYLLIP